MNESDVNMNDVEMYGEGEVIAQGEFKSDSIGSFFEHKDSVYCVNVLPREPFNIFVSGDGNDKALAWRLEAITEEEKKI